MVTNSIDFWIFFAVAFVAYHLTARWNVKAQNLCLLMASWVFYALADWRMMPLLLIVTAVFYYLAHAIARCNDSNPLKASRLTTIGAIVGVALLAVFKYLGFLVEGTAMLLSAAGLKVSIPTLQLVMPVGLSFFSFKLISYVVEVHRQTIRPCSSLTQFATYVAFFPTILSGPIDTPQKFLPQLTTVRKLNADDMAEGIKRVVWGMFLKMCIADRMAVWTDTVFSSYPYHNATTIVTAVVLYMIQLYADFSGYSEMAIGGARMLGLRVAENFLRPFMAKDVAEYWRRWHMSLTSWLNNYVFSPLALRWRDHGNMGIAVAAVVTLVLVGAWHGDRLTYVVFGLYHGLLLALVIVTTRWRKRMERKHGLAENGWYVWLRRLLTFLLCCLGISIFQAPSMAHVAGLWRQAFHADFGMPYTHGFFAILTLAVPSIMVLFFKEWKDEYQRNIHFFHARRWYVRVLSVALMVTYIIYTGELDGDSFIYFQF